MEERRSTPTHSKLSPTVVRLGLVSFFTDISSDMVAPLLPIFLTNYLGASLGFVGLVDGAADAVASFLKIFAGRWSDRARRHKPPTVAGYVLSAAARPLIALTTAPWHILTIRITDRVGKGIRSAPRDAWITHVTDASGRARAFGFHRAMDNAGAFVGPLLGLLLYRGFGLSLRWVFAACLVPGLFAIVAALGAKEDAANPNAGSRNTAPVVVGSLPAPLRLFLVSICLFSLANASDFFLVIKAKSLGVDDGVVLILWTALNGLKAVANIPGATLSDRLGRRPTLMAGWTLYAAVYFGFSFADGLPAFLGLLIAYAGYYGLTEGVERALVADLAPAESRGSAFGAYYALVGIAALPASYVFGRIADAQGIDLAFRVAAGFALAAALSLLVLVRRSK